eukprot:SAG22_NODE_584_length_8876_cov_42.811667_1_plen_245_part_10
MPPPPPSRGHSKFSYRTPVACAAAAVCAAASPASGAAALKMDRQADTRAVARSPMLFVPTGPAPPAAPSAVAAGVPALTTPAAAADSIRASASEGNVGANSFGPRSQFGHKKQLVSSTLSLEFPNYRPPVASSQSAVASNFSSGSLSTADTYPFRNVGKRNALSQAAYTNRLSRGQAAATTAVRQQAQQQSRVSHFGRTKPAGRGRIASGSRLGGRPGSAPARPSTAPPRSGSGSGGSGGGGGGG